jgi:hypothetical protein
MHPSTEGQERQNAYTDWLLRQRDEQELADEARAEAVRDARRYEKHRFHPGFVGPNFCDLCGSNVGLHQQIPYGERRSPQ